MFYLIIVYQNHDFKTWNKAQSSFKNLAQSPLNVKSIVWECLEGKESLRKLGISFKAQKKYGSCVHHTMSWRYAVFRDDKEKQEPMHTVAKVLNSPVTLNSYF